MVARNVAWKGQLRRCCCRHSCRPDNPGSRCLHLCNHHCATLYVDGEMTLQEVRFEVVRILRAHALMALSPSRAPNPRRSLSPHRACLNVSRCLALEIIGQHNWGVIAGIRRLSSGLSKVEPCEEPPYQDFPVKIIHMIGQCIGAVWDMCLVTPCRSNANRSDGA